MAETHPALDMQELTLGGWHPGIGLATRLAIARGTLSQRELEQAVAGLRQCIDKLGAEQRRVLTLRAGLGPRSALSRAQVAKRLGLGATRTERIERRGLRRLDVLADTGACGDAAASGAGSLVTTGVAALLADGAVGGDPTGDRSSRFGIGGVVAHGGGERSTDDRGRSSIALPPPIGDGSEATLLVALGLLVVLALLVRRELQRH